MVGACPEDDTEYVVVIGFGILQTFRDDRPNTAGPAVAFGFSIPGFAGVWRLGQKVSVAEPSKPVRVCEHIHAPRHDRVGVTIPERRAGSLNTRDS